MKKLISSALLLAVTSTTAFAFPKDNDPKFILGNSYNSKFKSLPLSGKLSDRDTPWASSFFPHIYGGIAFRWNGYYNEAPMIMNLQHQISELQDEILKLKQELFSNPNPTAAEIAEEGRRINEIKTKITELNRIKGHEHKKYFFDIARPTSLAQVRAMTQEERDQLSAAEKFDIYVALKTNSELSMTLTNDVLRMTGPYKAYWEGICNGWSSAAIEFHEPEVKTFTKNGITINMGSSDLKALLSHYHAALTNNITTRKKTVTGRVGQKCETEFPAEAWFIKDGKEYYRSVENGKVVTKLVPANCIDTDAGAFHIVITNQIALRKQGFVAEAVRDYEIWNQPVFAYDTEVVKETANIDPYATAKTRKQVQVKTRMFYANDGGRMFWQQPDLEEEFYAWWNPTNGTSNYRYAYKDFEYILDLDAQGEIIGGRWLSYERPDFLWLKKSKGFITGGAFAGVVNYMNHLQDFVTIR
jgi:hypothetical protein